MGEFVEVMDGEVGHGDGDGGKSGAATCNVAHDSRLATTMLRVHSWAAHKSLH